MFSKFTVTEGSVVLRRNKALADMFTAANPVTRLRATLSSMRARILCLGAYASAGRGSFGASTLIYLLQPVSDSFCVLHVSACCATVPLDAGANIAGSVERFQCGPKPSVKP